MIGQYPVWLVSKHQSNTPLSEIDVLILGGLYEGSQFIIIPGEVNVAPAPTNNSYWSTCNQGTTIHVFDTYSWEFKPEFDPDNKGPKVPPTIVDLIGGNNSGAAREHKPKKGWDDMALGDIFSIRNQPLPEESPKPDPIPDPIPDPTPPTSNKKAIIGGIIAGVCVVVLSTGTLIFLIKRCRKPSQLESELHGTSHRCYELPQTGSEGVELHETSHRHFELHAYEPPEIMSH